MQNVGESSVSDTTVEAASTTHLTVVLPQQVGIHPPAEHPIHDDPTVSRPRVAVSFENYTDNHAERKIRKE
jgi:hypothetical protein